MHYVNNYVQINNVYCTICIYCSTSMNHVEIMKLCIRQVPVDGTKLLLTRVTEKTEKWKRCWVMEKMPSFDG